MAFALLKLSYNNPGDSSLVGGICGTGFFITSQTAVTAHHVLNVETFEPNAGYRDARVWLVSRTGVVHRIQRDEARMHPDIDTTTIRFEKPVSNCTVYEPTVEDIDVGLSVAGIGHVGNAMPVVDAQWQGSELAIRSASLGDVTRDVDGRVKRSVIFEVNANDIKMRGVRGFELSIGSQVGMSGGPVLDRSSGRALGMLSLGLPPDSNVKTETFAVSIGEILGSVSKLV